MEHSVDSGGGFVDVKRCLEGELQSALAFVRVLFSQGYDKLFDFFRGLVGRVLMFSRAAD